MRPAAVLGAALGLSLFAAAGAAAEEPAAGAASHVSRAVELLLAAEQPTEAQLRQGFVDLLDALRLVAPKTRMGGAWPERLAEARRLIDAGSFLEPRAVALLGDCYRETHDGKPFQMPETVHSIADARDHIRLQLDAVPGLLKTGATDEAARRLLEAVVAIVTPMPR